MNLKESLRKENGTQYLPIICLTIALSWMKLLMKSSWKRQMAKQVDYCTARKGLDQTGVVHANVALLPTSSFYKVGYEVRFGISNDETLSLSLSFPPSSFETPWPPDSLDQASLIFTALAGVDVEETAEMPPTQGLCSLDLGWDNPLPEGMKEQSWAEYSTNIKLGVIDDTANRTRLAKLLRFTSSNGKLSSLAEYVERMKDKQESIFYMAGGSSEEVEKSPFVERLLKKGYEVLYLTEGVDEYAVSVLPEFEKKKFQDVVKEGFSFDRDTDTAKTRKEAIKEELSEKLGETKGSKNLDDQEMKNQVGPATKEIETVNEAEAILAETDVVIFAPGAADNPPAVQHAAAQNMDGENHIHPHSSSHSSIMNLFPSPSSSRVMPTMYPDTTDSPGNHLQLTPWPPDSSHLSTITFTCVTLAKLCEEAICNQNSIASDETYYKEMAYGEREDDTEEELQVSKWKISLSLHKERNHEGKDFSLEIINPGIVPGDVPHLGDGPGDVPDEVPHLGDVPGDVHNSGDVPVQADLQPGPGDETGDVPGDERAEHHLVQGDAPAAAPQLHKGSPNTIQPLTKKRVLPRYPEFHDKPTLDQILTLNLPGQVLDERQNDRNDQCNKQAVLSMPQDSDVPEEVEKVPVNAENDARSYEQAVLSVTLDLDDHKELYQEVCGEDEQLAISCFMSAFTKPSKWAMAGDSFTIVQGSAKYSLHQEGDGFIMSVMCCTSFNIERK